MIEQVQQRANGTAVVVAASHATAELMATSLRTHGVFATAPFLFAAYPSLGWAEGYAVYVDDENAELARELLASMRIDRDDVHVLDPDAPDFS